MLPEPSTVCSLPSSVLQKTFITVLPVSASPSHQDLLLALSAPLCPLPVGFLDDLKKSQSAMPSISAAVPVLPFITTRLRTNQVYPWLTCDTNRIVCTEGKKVVRPIKKIENSLNCVSLSGWTCIWMILLICMQRYRQKSKIKNITIIYIVVSVMVEIHVLMQMQ